MLAARASFANGLMKNLALNVKSAVLCLTCSQGRGVTQSLLNTYNSFYINDFLFSNEIIYKGFFLITLEQIEGILEKRSKTKKYLANHDIVVCDIGEFISKITSCAKASQFLNQ